ncbi:MAG TPA: hypothetical protein VKT22_08125 [Steroidobacteraceae bacterium]|nr:hypothetical protein [Steroidobacteraceae bacterium]
MHPPRSAGAAERAAVLTLSGVLLLSFASHSGRAAADPYAEADAIYAALRAQPHTALEVGGAEIDVVFAEGAAGLDRARTLDWINRSAQAVSVYFGHFPVKQVGVLIVATDGAEIGGGRTFGFGSPAIHVRVGRAADEAAFRRDWVLVHEMTHLALPTVPRRSEWLLEGNATYVEPIARAQAGQLDAAEVWRWTLEDMHKGEPQAGDAGLDHTSTWGRTYWGGAMFWLLADVRIHQRSGDRFGVQDALRAINRASGGNTARWSVDEVVRVGDQATGTGVLRELYDQMKDAPISVDLSALFEQLGVSEQGGQVRFNEGAPLARIRREITAPPRTAS